MKKLLADIFIACGLAAMAIFTMLSAFKEPTVVWRMIGGALSAMLSILSVKYSVRAHLTYEDYKATRKSGIRE